MTFVEKRRKLCSGRQVTVPFLANLSLKTRDFLRSIIKEGLKVILLHLRGWKIPVTIPTASTNLIDNLKEPIAKHVNKTYETGSFLFLCWTNRHVA